MDDLSNLNHSQLRALKKVTKKLELSRLRAECEEWRQYFETLFVRNSSCPLAILIYLPKQDIVIRLKHLTENQDQKLWVQSLVMASIFSTTDNKKEATGRP